MVYLKNGILPQFSLWFLIGVLCSVAIGKNVNYITVSREKASQRDVTIVFKGIRIFETTHFIGSEFEMKFKQISDGSSLVQTVYQKGEMQDCDYTENRKRIHNFVRTFPDISETIKTNLTDPIALYTNHGVPENQSETATTYFKHRKFLGPVRNLIKIHRDVRLCHKFSRRIQHKNHFHQHIKKFRKEEEKFMKKALDDITFNDDIIFHHVNKSYTTAHARIPRSLRKKRSMLDGFLMYPGTKWCGTGQTAREYHELGTDNELDMCCREHDLCPLLIPPFSSRFHYFNYRLHAILHCKCDLEFRHCLQQSLSKNANFVGKIYFNIMGSKCFVLHEADICTRYSWWGTCMGYRKDTVAHVKNQDYYTYEEEEDKSAPEILSNET